MSQWLDFSLNANKQRQTYFNGFVDISGGNVYVRSDNKLQFYTTADGVTPKFTINSTNMKIYDGVSQYHDVSNSKIIYIKDLSASAQQQLNSLFQKTQYVTSDATNTFLSTKLAVSNDTSLNANLYVGGWSEFYGDVSANSRLYVGQDTSLNANLWVAKDTTLQGRLFVQSDASLSSNLFVAGWTTLDKDVSMNSSLVVGGNAGKASDPGRIVDLRAALLASLVIESTSDLCLGLFLLTGSLGC